MPVTASVPLLVSVPSTLNAPATVSTQPEPTVTSSTVDWPTELPARSRAGSVSYGQIAFVGQAISVTIEPLSSRNAFSVMVAEVPPVSVMVTVIGSFEPERAWPSRHKRRNRHRPPERPGTRRRRNPSSSSPCSCRRPPQRPCR